MEGRPIGPSLLGDPPQEIPKQADRTSSKCEASCVFGPSLCLQRAAASGGGKGLFLSSLFRKLTFTGDLSGAALLRSLLWSDSLQLGLLKVAKEKGDLFPSLDLDEGRKEIGLASFGRF